MNTTSDFFSALFDMSFKEFITPRVISIVYVILIVLGGISALTGLIASFTQGAAGIFLGIPLTLLGFIAWLLMIRVGLEITIALFRIAENTTDIARRSGATVATEEAH